MKNVIKILGLSIIVVAMCVMTTNAQTKGDKAVGAGVVLGSGDSYSNYGFDAKFQYNILDHVRLEGAFAYYFKKDYTSMYDFSAYGHYLFNVGDVLTVYPLVGVGLFGVKHYGINYPDYEYGYDEDYEYGVNNTVKTYLAISFGGGVDFKLTEKLILNAEAKYKVIDNFNRFVISAGIAYRF